MWRGGGHRGWRGWGGLGGGVGRATACGALVLTGFSGCSRHHPYQAEWTVDELMARLDRGAAWMLWTVDAAEPQRRQVTEMVAGLKPELARFQQERGQLKQEMVRLLAADAIPPEDIERLRTAGRALTERVVDRSLETLFQVAAALTPEQRKVLMESWTRHL